MLMKRNPPTPRPWLALSLAVTGCLCVAATSLLPAAIGAEPNTASKSNQPPATPEQLARWAKELDHDSFVVREDATNFLIAAGAPAIEHCRKVLQQPTPETGSRALHILHQLALSNDLDALEQARAALEQVSRGKTTPLRARAEETLAQLNAQKQALTLNELQALGARIRRTQIFNGVGVDEVISSLEIGNDWRGTNDDFRRLRWLADVRQVAIVGDRVSDAALPYIASMKGLRSFQAYRAKITDAGLKNLATCEQLEDVGLYYIPLTNDSLEVLKGLKALANVRVYGTKATRAVANELQLAMAAGKVDFRDGAFLGVGCITVDTNCAISKVHTGSPADKAGIRGEDIVLSINGQTVPDFETLTMLIGKLEANDTAEIVVRRVSLDDEGRPIHKNHTIKVTLGEWPVSQFISGAASE